MYIRFTPGVRVTTVSETGPLLKVESLPSGQIVVGNIDVFKLLYPELTNRNVGCVGAAL